MQSTVEQFLPTGAASPWQLKRTSTEVTNPISYHDKIHPSKWWLFFLIVFFLNSIWWSSALAPSCQAFRIRNTFTDLLSLDGTRSFFLIELPSAGIHILYLTVPTLMIPCKAADKRHTFCLCTEREEKRHLTQPGEPKRLSLAAKDTFLGEGIYYN